MKYRGEPKTGKNQKQGRPEPDLSFFGYSNAISGNHGGSGTPCNKVCSAANVGEKLIETTVRVCDDGAFHNAETPR